MTRHIFVKKLRLPVSAHEAFAWHERPEALKLLIPPDDPVRVVEQKPGAQGPLGDGARVVLQLGKWPFAMHWIAVHEGFVADRQFIDLQEHGPFAYWKHTHLFTPVSDTTCVLEDRVEYALPLGAIGDAIAHDAIRDQIERMFAWRHRVTFDALVRPEIELR